MSGCEPASSVTSTTFSTLQEKSHLLAQSIRDRQFALSLSTAIALDQHIIAQVLQDEATAESDHAMAVALSQGVVYNPPKNEQPKVDAKDASVDAMCETITNLAQMRSTKNEEEDNVIAQSLRFGRDEEKCVACLEIVTQLPVFESACGHIYCNGCTRSLLLGAALDEQLYPPRCCNSNIPPSVPLHLLDFKELSNFTAKGVEFSCSDRLYCAKSDCSTFLLPCTIADEQARCPECKSVTHTRCKALYESGHECPSDEALRQLLKLASEQKWMRCPQCKTMIELRSGCHHMTCK